MGRSCVFIAFLINRLFTNQPPFLTISPLFHPGYIFFSMSNISS